MTMKSVGMNIVKGNFSGFQPREIERALLDAATAGITGGAEYCIICDNRNNCPKNQKSTTICWLKCDFVFSRERFQKMLEELNVNSRRGTATAV